MEIKERTILEFFNEFPEPYKTQAIHNYNEKPLSKDKHLHHWAALISGFEWALTKEEGKYWDNFYKDLVTEKVILTAGNHCEIY